MSGSVRVVSGRCLRVIALMAIVLSYLAAAALPVCAQSFSVNLLKQEYELCPGEKFTGSIPVINTSEQPISLRVYLGDWVRVPGQSEYTLDEQTGREPRSLVGWMTYSPDSMTLQPGEERDVTFEVDVPDDWSLSGSYWGLVFVQGLPTEDASVSADASEEVDIGLKTVYQYAVQIYATIAGTEVRAAAFTTLNLEQEEGALKATAILQNNGNTFIRPKVWLELHDPSGAVVYTQDHQPLTVLPESTRDFDFELKDLPVPPGQYLVMILADYGMPNLIAAQGRVTLTASPPQESATTGEGESGASGEGSPSG